MSKQKYLVKTPVQSRYVPSFKWQPFKDHDGCQGPRSYKSKSDRNQKLYQEHPRRYVHWDQVWKEHINFKTWLWNTPITPISAQNHFIKRNCRNELQTSWIELSWRNRPSLLPRLLTWRCIVRITSLDVELAQSG